MSSSIGADEIAHHQGGAGTDLDVRVSLEMIEATRDYEARAALIRAFVRQDPARAALVVRDLIRTESGAERHG